MTANEYYELAKSNLNGENGAGVDKEKGLEYLKLAAEAGHKEATLLYVNYALDTDASSCVELLSKVIDEKAKMDELDAYYTALAACAKQNPEKAGECKALAQKWIKAPNSATKAVNARYAELLAIAEPENEQEIKIRYRIAALDDGWFNLDSNLVYDPEILEKYNFDNNLISPKDMMHSNERLKKNEIEAETSQYRYKGFSNRFVKITKSEEFAAELVKGQLNGEKPSAAKKISNEAWAKMKEALPAPTLIFEKFRGLLVDIGECGYRFTHQAHDSITKHTGSGRVRIDGAYGEFVATYICEKQDDDLMQYVNSLEYCELSDVPENALLRAGKRAAKKGKNLSTRMDETLDAIVASEAKMNLFKEYNWLTKDIEVTRLSTETEKLAEYDRAVYVPYYYYVFDIDGEKITVRVNAFDGAISYFVNNEYGQIQTAEEKKASKKAGDKKKKKFKGWMIPIIIGGAIVAIGILSSFITGFIEGMQM